MEIRTKTKLTCPECSFVQEVDMPIDACQYSYHCIKCKSVLTAKEGDCCVFCSYGDVPCPSKQKEIGEQRVVGGLLTATVLNYLENCKCEICQKG